MLSRCLFVLTTCTATLLAAPESLQQQLFHKVLTLKHYYTSKKQSYDAAGNLAGASAEGDWQHNSMLQVTKARVHDGRVEIEGRRVVVDCNRGNTIQQLRPALSTTSEKLKISVTLPSSSPSEQEVNTALRNVFADRNDVLPHVPEYFRMQYDQIMSGDWAKRNEAPRLDSRGVEVYYVGGSVKAPHPTKMIQPEYTDAARQRRTNGTAVLGVIIDESGVPEDVEVLCSLSPDLDRNSIVAAKQWRFEPATKDGQPVTVSAVIETNFQIH